MTGAVADDRRAATIATLRARIARLGGLPTPGGAPRGLRLAGSSEALGDVGRRHLEGAGRVGGAEASADALGFRQVRNAAGTAFVRRVDVDLGPFLERAAATRAASPEALLRLTVGAGPGEPVAALDEGDCAVLDIETLGLRGSGVLAFLIGIGVPRGSHLDIDQLLLVDPGAEAAQLISLLEQVTARRLLVTYNGRSFDLPVLRSRCIVNRIRGEALESRLHCDLLSPVRRLFRDRLGACTLRQAELALLGFERDEDAPGWEAPERYRRWLRHGDGPALEGVVRHNQLDLCATMVLGARLVGHCDGALVEPIHPADRYRLAVHLERVGGVREEVDRHYRAALAGRQQPWDRHAAHRLGRRLRRGAEQERHEALRLFRSLWERDRTDMTAARALCIGEERSGRLEAALEVAEQALDSCASLGWRAAHLRGAPRGGWGADWERRRARLSLRLARRRALPGAGELRPQAPPGAVAAGAVVTPPLLAHCS